MISVLLYCSVTSTFEWLRLSLLSVLFRSRRFHVPAIWSALGRIRIFFYLPDIRLFRVWIEHQIVSSRVPVYFRVLLL